MAQLVKWLGYLVIGFAYFMGMIAFDEWLVNRTPGYLTAYLIMGVGVFLVGLFILIGTKMFSSYIFKSKSLRSFLFLTTVGPFSLNLLDWWRNGQYRNLANLKDVWLMPGSFGWLDYFLCGTGVAFLFTMGAIFIFGSKETGKYVISLCVVSLLLTSVLFYITMNDYEAIRADGIVIQKLGDKEEIAWSKVRHVDILGYLSRDGASKTSTRSFKWEFVFYLNDGTKKAIGPFKYNDYFLTGSLDIKKLIMDKKIQMATDRITEEEWGFIKVDMKYEVGNRDDFYEIFQYDPKTKEYYSITYD
ncbi:hypothetical protein [Bacillus sp. FJAT-27445]|uniref:hypothetical protein n=1 Tax=Bacillus sp. FJAT-27445 TaxID=1679166 RepID=UPI0007442013|nr:hypothetical protein [Bacillus sp. FJAT-27445]